MVRNRRVNFAVMIIMLAVVFSFAYIYNAAVTQSVVDNALNDKAILQAYNGEIIDKLTNQESADHWSDIVEQYEDIVIVIEDSSNKVVVRSEGRYWNSIDVKVRTPFEYKGKAYVIASSVYLLRDYVADVRTMMRFVFIEFFIGISAFLLLIFIIYTITLRPYRLVYRAIEEYDTAGELPEVKLKGYAGIVYRRFVSMTENIEQQRQNQNRIIASISHDIKTPLTSIMGYAERLKKGGISEERKERYLETVYEKSAEIRELVDEFDEYLGVESHTQSRAQKITCNALCRLIEKEYGDELEYEGIHFLIHNHADNAEILVDMQKIKRVFGNIISNSVKHFDKKKKVILVELNCDKEKVTVDISDSGEGVAENMYEMIFEPFYTGDEGRKVAGLGLSICREIIDSHGGKIKADTSVFGGLKISFELPRCDKRLFIRHKTKNQ